MTNSPEDYARALLHHLELDRVLDAEAAAAQCQLLIRNVDSSKFEGALVRRPNGPGGIIAVKRSIREQGRRRFTIAHEIGHFIMPGHGVAECYCKSTMIESWRKDAVRMHEYEANRFASEVLLPARLLHPIVNANGLTFAQIKEVARQFSTSLTATAVKCAEVTEEKCAVVFTIDGVVKWVFRNDGFQWFVPKAPVIENTLAGRLVMGDSQRELSGAVQLGVWTDDEDVPMGTECWEESITLPYYNAVLTILTL